MTIPEIPEEAVELLDPEESCIAYQDRDDPSASSLDREALRGRLDQLWGWAKSGKTKDPDGGDYYLMDVENVDQFTRHVLDLLPAPHPRPVVDREAVLGVMADHRLCIEGHSAAGAYCACGWDLDGDARNVRVRHAAHQVDAVLALLPTEEGEGSEVYFCPASGEMEIHPGGGFDTCCDRPQDHQTDIKWLTKLCHRLGKAEGRKETIDEFAAACADRARLANRMPEPERSGVREGMLVAWIAAEKLALGMASQPNGAAAEGLTGAPASTGTPENSQAGRIRIPAPDLTKGDQ